MSHQHFLRGGVFAIFLRNNKLKNEKTFDRKEQTFTKCTPVEFEKNCGSAGKISLVFE